MSPSIAQSRPIDGTAQSIGERDGLGNGSGRRASVGIESPEPVPTPFRPWHVLGNKTAGSTACGSDTTDPEKLCVALAGVLSGSGSATKAVAQP